MVDQLIEYTNRNIELHLPPVTDLISAVVRLLREDMNGLVVEAQEALEPVEAWDEG